MDLETAVVAQLRAEDFDVPAGLFARVRHGLLDDVESERGKGAQPPWSDALHRHAAWRQFRKDWRLETLSRARANTGQRRSRQFAGFVDEALTVLLVVVLRRVLLLERSRPALRRGDGLAIALPGLPAPTLVRIDAEGLIALPPIGSLPAAGMSAAELAQKIQATDFVREKGGGASVSVKVTERDFTGPLDLAEIDAWLNDWFKAYKGEENSPAEELLDGYALLLTSRVLVTGSRSFGDFWLFRELAEACAAVRYPAERRELRPLLTSDLEDRRAERIPGKQSGVRDIVRKTEEDQIKDILPTELAPFHYSAAARYVVVDKVVNGGPLIVQRFREDRPELRHRVLLTVLAAADPNEIKPSARAAVAVRALTYRVLTQLALARQGLGVTIDVALFDRRDEAWCGVVFPLDQLRVQREPMLRWCNVAAFDRLVTSFFARWPDGGTTSGAAVPIGLPPGPWLSRHRVQRQHDFYPVVSLRHRDEGWSSLEESMASLPNPAWLPFTRLDAAVTGDGDGVQFRSLRATAGRRFMPVAMEEGDETDFAGRVCNLIIGPAVAAGDTVAA